MQTVVENPTMLNAAERTFDLAEIPEIIDTVAAGPECGDVIAGTWGASGSFGSPVKRWETVEALVSLRSRRTNAAPSSTSRSF
jgi:hypothetical protein